VQVVVEGPAQRLDYSAEVEEHLYRIALEAINNSIKHAQAATVRVNITAVPRVEMMISDDGTGFDTSQDRPGHLGLGNMRERAMSIGATLTVESATDCGTTVRLAVA
jgi:signal transduction histidine kinase